MRLLVLGRNADDKGKQLEELTRRLLTSLGYKDLDLNVRASGASEIDVRGVYPVPGMERSPNIRLIAECKAYEARVALPEWLKFLGKVYSEVVRSPSPIRGIFIALSGVNGSVSGAFDEFSTHNEFVELVSGERLATLITREFRLAEVEAVALRAQELTSDPTTELFLGYYGGEAFWIIQFANSTFTALFGPTLDSGPPQELVELLIADLGGLEYRSLHEEARAQERLRLGRQFLLSKLVAEGALTQGAMIEPDDRLELSSGELQIALNDLFDEGVVNVSDGTVDIRDLSGDISAKLSFLRELTHTRVWTFSVGTLKWNSLINDDLLDEVLALQGNVPVSDEYRTECLQLLRWSPSALAWALEPDPMLFNHRSSLDAINPDYDKNDERYFRLQLMRAAVGDFFEAGLTTAFYDKFGLRELEFERRAKFKSRDRVELEMELTERLAIGVAADELGGGLLKIWVYEGAPQPWDNPRPDQNETGS